MKKQYTMFLVLLLGLLGFSTHAEGPTFNLLPGSPSGATVWAMFGGKLGDLQVGSNNFGSSTNTIIVAAGENQTFETFVNESGDEQYIEDAQYGDYGGDFAYIDGWDTGTYTIKTREKTEADKYLSIEFNVTGKIVIKSVSQGYPPVLTDVQTLENVNKTIQLPKGNTYWVFPAEGYSLESASEMIMDGGQYGKYVAIQPSTTTLTMVTKADTPAGTNFYLEEGNAYLFDCTAWTKVQDLNPGDNYIQLSTANARQSYAICGVGVTKAADLIITDADGNGVYVRDYNDPDLGYNATFYASSASSKYTIKAIASTEEPTFHTTHIIVPEGTSVSGKYQDMSTYSWVNVELPVGDNEVKIPLDVIYFRIVATDGQTLESLTAASGATFNTSTNTITGEVYYQLTAAEFEASYTVTTDGTVKQPGNTFTVIVDDASKMSFCNSKYNPISLTNGENVITIEETYRYIFYSTSGGFYSVTLNDEPLADLYGTYYLPVKNLAGSVLNIKANYPDENWTYAINFTSEPVEWERAAISEIVDGELVYTDIPMSSNTSITAKAGSEICLWAKDADSFDRNQTTVTCTGKGNESAIWYNNSNAYNITFKLVENNGTLTVNAVKVAPPKDINFHLNAGSAASIHRYANDQLSKYQSLNEGDNVVAIPNDGNLYYIVANNKGAELTVKDDKDNTLNAQAHSSYFDGRKFVMVTGVDSKSFDITTVGGEVEDNDNNNITVTVNTPSAVKFYSYYSPYRPESSEAIDITLEEGTHTVKIPKSVSQMSIVPADAGSVINSVSYKEADSEDWQNANAMVYPQVTYYDVWAKDGLELKIDAGHVTYDSHAVVYTDNGNNNSVTMTSESGRKIMLGSGANEVAFNAADSKFTVTNRLNAELKIYVNGTKIEGNVINLTNNDIVKIFQLSDAPVSVTFAINAAEAEIEGVKVTDVKVDGVTPVDYPTEAVSVLPGTEVSFKVEAPDEVTIKVMVGEDEVTASDGVYTVWPTADTEVEITYTAKEAFALIVKGSKIGEVTMTETDGLWTATVPELTGSFTIVSNDGTVKLGSNGSKVELGKAYEASEDSSVSMSLDCGSASDVTVTVDLEKKTVLVNGTTGIITLTRDQLDADAIYYDLTGRRIETANIANGLYIRVAGQTVTKIAVK